MKENAVFINLLYKIKYIINIVIFIDAHSPCVDHHCSQIGSHCILDAAGRPTCECVQYCSPKVFKGTLLILFIINKFIYV